MSITPEIQKRIDYWLNGPFDQRTKEDVRTLMKGNPQALIDAFFADLTFGTGGMRDLMGVGTNRLNIYTIRQATQGLANYLKKEGKAPLSVVIGFDSRHHSQEFAGEAARVLAGNGIKVHLLPELRPTPYISFACRFMHASAAINITASHNPADYNGYKVYWSDGAQVVPPHDVGIVKEVEAIKDFSQVKLADLSSPLIHKIDLSLDDEYLKAIDPLQHVPEQNHAQGHSLKIVYTSLHGTGITIVPKALNRWGFTSVETVKKQCIPDGDFPTVKFPNPEYKETLSLGTAQLEHSHSDILIANDPDADRIGIVAMHKGKPIALNGNQMAAICIDYICRMLTDKNKMPQKGAFVTTIVTTELLKAIASSYHKECFEVLTGFKYIGELIHRWETEPNGYQFIFGAEESYGCLLGTVARDKDAIIASCLIAEIALDAKLQGQTLIDKLNQIYQRYGVYCEEQISINFQPGKEGMDQMKALMERLRAFPHRDIASIPVVYVEDYQKRERLYLEGGKKEELSLPKSNVLLYRLKDQSRLVIRPSGTEPKIKIYGAVSKKEISSVENGTKACNAQLELLLKSFKALLT
jgi:phosphoglucomutase/phosphomannomutase